jgi:hypothetical protein
MDEQHKRVAVFHNVSSPQDLQILKPEEIEADNIVISFQGEWQVGHTSRLDNILYNNGHLHFIVEASKLILIGYTSRKYSSSIPGIQRRGFGCFNQFNRCSSFS